MLTYLKNGLIGDYNLDAYELEGDFYVQDLGKEGNERFTYPGDSDNYTLDTELSVLYDTMREIFFDADLYYSEVYLLPVFIQTAGQDSDCSVSAKLFSEWINESSVMAVPNVYKHLYLVDCQFYVGTIQNHLAGMERLFIDYFTLLPNIEAEIKFEVETTNTTMMVMSSKVRSISDSLENYFIKAYSILDMLCKIAYEIEKPQKTFDKYVKTKSAGILWGERKNLRINGQVNTLFEKCDLVNMIESLRNEVVHNGTWELSPKVFIRYQDKVVAEKFMLFPDMIQGRLDTVKNRKHFFSNGVKVNDVLPMIHSEFKARLIKTINYLNQYS